jgi:beta-lactamase class D
MRILNFLITTVVITFQLFAEEHNFLLYDLNANQWVQELGPHCDDRTTPCCSFNFALSVMGFDAEILIDASTPELPYQEKYAASEKWRTSHTPALWMRQSCLWFSKELTTRLGMARFQWYVDLLDYGNQDLSGGVTQAWINSSLKVSPREQVLFLKKLMQGELPVSEYAMQMTKKITFLEEIEGWELHGKTGSGDLDGWFVGWIEKGGQLFLFAWNVRDEEKVAEYGGARAKAKTIACLKEFIRDMSQRQEHRFAPESRL